MKHKDPQSHKSFFRLFVALALSVHLSSCKVEDGSSTLAQYAGDIKLSLAHALNADRDDYELLFSTPLSVEKLIICEGDGVCSANTAQTYGSELIYYTDSRKFFRSEYSVLLENGLKLTFSTLGSSGTVEDLRTVEFQGQSSTGTSGQTPSTPIGLQSGQTGSGSQGQISAQQVTQIVGASCGGAGCHDQYAANPSSIPRQSAITRMQSGNMPRGRSMSQSDKDLLIRYLSGG